MMTTLILYVDCLVFQELWVFPFKNGIGVDDRLALMDYANLEFLLVLLFVCQLHARKGLWHIIQAIEVTQSVTPHLYIIPNVLFSSTICWIVLFLFCRIECML
jgi:succinate dehydrogenase hydrophobic anchor subunit